LSEYERGEIANYAEVYFIGKSKEKPGSGHNYKDNYGFDDERGDYKVVMKDHLSYRYEVVGLLGSGSFGQALKCLDHKTQSFVAVKVIRNKKRF
jgi:dual specificity tyrosine-phosphorylation-regulated kinase 2/3/4